MKFGIDQERYIIEKVETTNPVVTILIEVIEETTKILVAHLKDNQFSLYLYGGIVQGSHDPRYSDLDLLVYLPKLIGEVDKNEFKSLEMALSKRYSNNFAYVGVELIGNNEFVGYMPT